MVCAISVNNTFMREIGTGITLTKERVRRLKGLPLIIKVNGGRGKCTLFYGEVIDVFPSVFTVKTSDGDKKTFSYSDVHAGSVLFLKPQ